MCTLTETNSTEEMEVWTPAGTKGRGTGEKIEPADLKEGGLWTDSKPMEYCSRHH